jgi:metal-sulfur cluster biosynthetic enzyme
MTPTPHISLPTHLDREAVLSRLERVLDPELDESVLSLGFVESVTGDESGNVEVCLRLPTYWCAANFSYLMASDVRRELTLVDGVQSVTVRLGEHFAGGEVEEGSMLGKSFGEAFPKGGPDTLEETRQIFLRKGYLGRQQRLLQSLRRAGMSFEKIAALRVGDAKTLPVEARLVERYLERRGEIGLECLADAPLVVNLQGETIPPGELETYYVRARTTRLAMEASGALCSAMLESRNANWASASQPESKGSRQGSGFPLKRE